VTTGRVVGLQRTPARRFPPERLDEATVRADWGIEGDRHARPASSRQVVVTQAEVLEALRLPPGATREQLTVSGLGELGPGDVLEIGTTRLEVVRPRVPCRVMDEIRPGLLDELRGRGGWCTRVLAGGTLRPGDVVTVGHVDDAAWLTAYRRALGDWEASPPRADDGWASFADRLAHLVAWDQRGAERIAALAAGAQPEPGPATDIDAFNAAAVDRLRGRDLWLLHDDWSTAVIDAARRWPEHGESWVRSLTAHYREHT
jgi:MOSC domain-containing protein YiiM